MGYHCLTWHRGVPRVTSSLLTRSNINFVIEIMEGRCGSCGIQNAGKNSNQFPWFVAIKEKIYNTNIYHTGTLVSREWVLTTASIFVPSVISGESVKDPKHFKALVGAKEFTSTGNWKPITEIRAHPKYHLDYQFDLAMLKLKDRVREIPHPSDVIVDTIRPICLPYTTQNLDVPISQKTWNSRSLRRKETKIMSSQECKDSLGSNWKR